MTKPLFIWAGGKTKCIKYYSEIFPARISKYSEPFFGGGAMFLHVMKEYQPEEVVINDLNKDVIRIYECVRGSYDEFLRILSEYEEDYLGLEKPQRKEYYYNLRNAHAYDYESWATEKEAATLYFLMKTGFNGIYQVNKNTNGRYGTPSGLLNQRGSVFDRRVLKYWNEALQGVKILSGDWRDAVMEDGFVFMDPPYRDSFADYGNSFSDEDLKDLISVAETCESVMLCNRESGDGFFETNRGKLEMKKFDITYTAGRRKRVEGGYKAKKAVEVVLYKKNQGVGCGVLTFV